MSLRRTIGRLDRLSPATAAGGQDPQNFFRLREVRPTIGGVRQPANPRRTRPAGGEQRRDSGRWHGLLVSSCFLAVAIGTGGQAASGTQRPKSLIVIHPAKKPQEVRSCAPSATRGEIALDAAGEIPYSRLLTSQTKCFADNRWSLSTDRNCHNPRGWVCIWGPRDDEVPADHEAFDRPHGSERHASDKPSAPAVAIRGSCGDRAATERPIAPGKVSCPSPPWDAAFPGAFFAHRWRLCTRFWPGSNQGNTSRADSERIKQASISCPYGYPLFCEPLGLDEGDRFLEVGAGSGYGAAVAREVVGPNGLARWPISATAPTIGG